MSSNEKRNTVSIKKFREELEAMLVDIKAIDKKVLNKAVNVGLAEAKKDTPVDTGFLRRMWFVDLIENTGNGIEKELYNAAEYVSDVNYGHKTGRGFVQGHYMLEKAVSKTEKTMAKEFEKEVKRVNNEHGK